jgi:hypothetical protein
MMQRIVEALNPARIAGLLSPKQIEKDISIPMMLLSFLIQSIEVPQVRPLLLRLALLSTFEPFCRFAR